MGLDLDINIKSTAAFVAATNFSFGKRPHFEAAPASTAASTATTGRRFCHYSNVSSTTNHRIRMMGANAVMMHNKSIRGG